MHFGVQTLVPDSAALHTQAQEGSALIDPRASSQAVCRAAAVWACRSHPGILQIATVKGPATTSKAAAGRRLDSGRPRGRGRGTAKAATVSQRSRDAGKTVHFLGSRCVCAPLSRGSGACLCGMLLWAVDCWVSTWPSQKPMFRTKIDCQKSVRKIIPMYLPPNTDYPQH